MKANEFIKDYGLEEAAYIVSEFPDDICVGYASSSGAFNLNIADLKHFIEAHQLVKAVGGLKKAKVKANSKFKPVGKNLLKAIADVESCQ